MRVYHQDETHRKKGLNIGMVVKALASQNKVQTSVMGKRKYKVFIANPVQKGHSLMSIAKYNKDSGEIENERRKANNG